MNWKVWHAIYRYGFKDCNNDDIQKWLNIDKNNPGHESTTRDDIILSSNVYTKEDMTECGGINPCSILTHSEAENALNIALQWAKRRKETDTVQMFVSEGLRNLAGFKSV